MIKNVQAILDYYQFAEFCAIPHRTSYNLVSYE